LRDTRGAWVWVLPAVAALALYARTLGYAFVWDDLDLVVRHAALHGPAWAQTLLQDFWVSTGGGTGMWRPLVTLSYRVDGVLSGWRPWMFHLGNVLAFAVATALLARLALARGATRTIAIVAALVYATAPAISESVAWIAGRTDAYAALFTLAALVLARAHREHGGRAFAAGSLACTALALLAKETALVLPLLIAADAIDGAGEGARGRAAWRSAWPPAVVVVVWAVLHRLVVAGSTRPPDPGAAAGMAALVWAHLIWLAPWAPHSPLLDLWQPPHVALVALAWAGLVVVAVRAAGLARRRVALLLPLALLFLPLMPVAGASLLESGVRFAERALALPVAGLALGLASLAALVPAPRRALAAGAIAVWALVQTAFALAPIAAWADEESRIRRVAEVRPRDLDALLGLADLLSTEGREREALGWIARAEAVDPRSAGPPIARASLAFRSGRIDEALAYAERAGALEPASLAAGVIRVRSLARLGRAADAVAAGDSLVAFHRGDPAAMGALGAARLASGDAAGAVPPLREASQRLLDDAGLAWDLGRAAIAVRDIPLAREAFERAVTAAPEAYDAWLGVADTRSRMGDVAGAEAALRRAESLPGAGDGRADTLRARIAQRMKP
jgi:tetratricopeptide (TPR) repeat protein